MELHRSLLARCRWVANHPYALVIHGTKDTNRVTSCSPHRLELQAASILSQRLRFGRAWRGLFGKTDIVLFGFCNSQHFLPSVASYRLFSLAVALFSPEPNSVFVFVPIASLRQVRRE